MLLDPEGCSVSCIGEVSQSSKCICRGKIRHSSFSKGGVVQGDGGLLNFQREGCEERSCSNGADIQEG
ncbi:unnamed protein product [Musa textilis]